MAVSFDEKGESGEVEAVEEAGEGFREAGLNVVDVDFKNVDAH